MSNGAQVLPAFVSPSVHSSLQRDGVHAPLKQPLPALHVSSIQCCPPPLAFATHARRRSLPRQTASPALHASLGAPASVGGVVVAAGGAPASALVVGSCELSPSNGR